MDDRMSGDGGDPKRDVQVANAAGATCEQFAEILHQLGFDPRDFLRRSESRRLLGEHAMQFGSDSMLRDTRLHDGLERRPRVAQLSVIAFLNAATSVVADFNHTHVLNPAWPPHARFHSALGICVSLLSSTLALVLLWRRSGDSRTNLTIGAMLSVLYLVGFFPALLVPGVSLDNPGSPMIRILGIPFNLVFAAACIVVAAVAAYVGRKTPQGMPRLS